MRAHMTWLDEARSGPSSRRRWRSSSASGSSSRGRPRCRCSRSSERRGSLDRRRALSARARAARRRRVPAARAVRRRVAGARCGPGRRRAGALLLVGVRRLRPRPRDRRQASLHARRPAGGHGRPRRGARGRRHVDDRHGGRRARRGPRTCGLLRGAHRGAQARDPGRQPVTGRAAAAHHGRDLRRRRRGVPRAAAVQHAPHGGLPAAHRWAAARFPRRHGACAGRPSRCTPCPWPGPPRR